MENCNNFPGPEPDQTEDALCAAWQQLKQCAQGKLGQKNFEHVLERFAHQGRLGDGNLLVTARDHVCTLPAIDRARMEDLLVAYHDMSALGFKMSMSRFVEVAELLESVGIDEHHSIALVAENRRLYFEVSSLLDRTDLLLEAKKEALEIYLDLYDSDEIFRSFIDLDFAAFPSFLWPFIRDIGIEVAIELIKKYAPGSEIEDAIEAIGNLGQGDVLGFFAEVIDILKKRFPAIAAINLTVDGVVLGSKAGKAWKAIARMRDFPNSVIEKFLQTIKSQTGGVLGRLSFKKGTGAILNDVADPIEFWDELISLFPDANPVNLPPNSFFDEAFDIFGGGIQFRIKVGGGTMANDEFTIEIQKGASVFKIRFPS